MRVCALHLDTCLVTWDTCPQHSPARTQALRGKGVVSVGAAWALGTRTSSPRLVGRSLKKGSNLGHHPGGPPPVLPRAASLQTLSSGAQTYQALR